MGVSRGWGFPGVASTRKVELAHFLMHVTVRGGALHLGWTVSGEALIGTHKTKRMEKQGN